LDKNTLLGLGCSILFIFGTASERGAGRSTCSCRIVLDGGSWDNVNVDDVMNRFLSSDQKIVIHVARKCRHRDLFFTSFAGRNNVAPFADAEDAAGGL
jgi:hypothetical protein